LRDVAPEREAEDVNLLEFEGGLGPALKTLAVLDVKLPLAGRTE
jgi:hypothetical protein